MEKFFEVVREERRLWLEMPASPGHNPVHRDGRDIQRLGPVDPGREENHDFAPGNNRAVRTERFHGSPEPPAMGHFQGAGAVSVGGQGLSADTGGLDNHPRRNARQTESLENSEEIDHDRTGAHSQKHLAHLGTGIECHPENARHIPGQPPAQLGEPRPNHSSATGERGQFRVEQQESVRHLQRVSDIHANLKPLLSRLSALLNAK